MSRAAVDLTPDPNLDRVADIALGMAVKIRDEDPRRLYSELVALAQQHPAKAAQVTMCLAAWLDPDTSTSTLWARVEAITEPRAGRRLTGVAS
ncbi:hypothetical protein [Mycolicibacterium fortuitum]|uniref:hypothetical protein n=1 Tax=Mycolicibacterium fortuitum TaxID=1766 RepID=UPI0009D6ADE4|nr:hypothetical protein [Mycolicibacterium fortuitum]